MNYKNIYQTIEMRLEEDLCFLKLFRPKENNTINNKLIEECKIVLELCREKAKIIVIEGLPEVFCMGADFKTMIEETLEVGYKGEKAEPLYDLWYQLSTGPYITIAHVRGKTNAGGIGFVSACDLVLANSNAEFSLSELLFGVMPACVLPFLIRRIGYQKAHYLTLISRSIGVKIAKDIGLVDDYEQDSVSLLKKYLLRLRLIKKTGITRYKKYICSLDDFLIRSKNKAIAANIEVFSDIENIKKIRRYVRTGKFPWEN